MCGNLVPPWEDKAGALARRFVLVHFAKIVPDSEKDGSLKQMMAKEMGFIVPKLSQAYMYRTKQIGRKTNMWNAMPPVFKQWARVFQQQVDLVLDFVQESGLVTLAPEGYCLESLFLESFREFTKQKRPNMKNVTWTKDTYQHFFLNHNIQIVDSPAPWGGSIKRAKYIIGIRHIDFADTHIDNMC